MNRQRDSEKMTAWQDRWEKDTEGKKTYSKAYGTNTKLESYPITHGSRAQYEYYRRFNLRQTNGHCKDCNTTEN